MGYSNAVRVELQECVCVRLRGAIICEGQADVQRSSSWVPASVNSLLVTADYKYLRFRSISVFSPAQNNHSLSGIGEEQQISSLVLWPWQRALSSSNLPLVVNLSVLFLVKTSQWSCVTSFRIRLFLLFVELSWVNIEFSSLCQLLENNILNTLFSWVFGPFTVVDQLREYQ